MKKFKVGIITFSHPMVYGTSADREAFVEQEYRKLQAFVTNAGFEALDAIGNLPIENRPRFGIATNKEAELAALWLQEQQAECLVINLNQWTNPHMCAIVIKALNIPSAIYVSGGIHYPGETTAAAVFGSITESYKASRSCLMLERFRESNPEQLVKWVKGAAAVERLRKSRVLCWGGTYGANIPYTRDDEALIEDTMVREVIYESEEYITYAAQKMLKEDPQRIERFKKWLLDNGASIEYDGKMLTQDSFSLQIAQYFAVKDRLAFFKEENISNVSVKCHFDVSTECLGCTECMIPAFLPLSEDSEGKKTIIPVSCEGDLKGALTSAILSIINPDVPPLFGDVIVATDEHITVSNCGASSVYWSDRSGDMKSTLSKVRIMPQLHGASGGSTRYLSAPGVVTAARLFRLKGRYYMYMGAGRIEHTSYTSSTHGVHWPQTLVTFDTNHEDIFKTIPCQHLVLTGGDITEELDHYCRYMGIRTIRCDDANSLNRFREMIAYDI